MLKGCTIAWTKRQQQRRGFTTSWPKCCGKRWKGWTPCWGWWARKSSPRDKLESPKLFITKSTRCGQNMNRISCQLMECWRKFQKSIILLWTDVNYDYVNYVKDVWCKKNNNMIMYKKDTVHNVTQLKQYDVQKTHCT